MAAAQEGIVERDDVARAPAIDAVERRGDGRRKRAVHHAAKNAPRSAAPAPSSTLPVSGALWRYARGVALAATLLAASASGTELKVIARYGVGYDKVDVKAAKAKANG